VFELFPRVKVFNFTTCINMTLNIRVFFCHVRFVKIRVD
jgi:hypothetical protein